MQIRESRGQFSNTCSSIEQSLERDSNVTVGRKEHSEKHFWQILWADEGMQIEQSSQHSRNAKSPRTESLEPDSNVTTESR
jgi:hypothetical protein